MRARALDLVAGNARRHAPRCVLVMACLAGSVISIHSPAHAPLATVVILAGVFWYLLRS